MFNLTSFLSESLQNVKNMAKSSDLSEHDSEDVAALVVADFYKKYQQGRINVENNPQGFLAKLARWRITDKARRNIKKSQIFSQIGEENNLDELSEKTDDSQTKHRLKIIKSALKLVYKNKKERKSQCSDRDCEIFRQTIFESKSAEEIADSLKTTKQVVYLARHRVGAKIKEEIEKWNLNSL